MFVPNFSSRARQVEPCARGWGWGVFTAWTSALQGNKIQTKLIYRYWESFREPKHRLAQNQLLSNFFSIIIFIHYKKSNAELLPNPLALSISLPIFISFCLFCRLASSIFLVYMVRNLTTDAEITWNMVSSQLETKVLSQFQFQNPAEYSGPALIQCPLVGQLTVCWAGCHAA